MNWKRIKALLWRHNYDIKHNLGRLLDTFYWPAVDIVLWGLTSSYFQKTSMEVSNLVLILLSALVFWQIIWRGQYEISVNLLEELWSHNLVNLFTTPLTIFEWIMAMIILGLIRMLVTVGFAIGLVYLMYGANILEIGLMLVPFACLLLMSGWYIGLVAAGIILRFGMRLEIIAWSGVYLLAPFSAIYYPVSVLPGWAQKIAAWIPASYIFEGMRAVLSNNTIDKALFIKSAGLSLIYLLLSLGFFLFCFNQSRKSGLARLE